MFGVCGISHKFLKGCFEALDLSLILDASLSVILESKNANLGDVEETGWSWGNHQGWLWKAETSVSQVNMAPNIPILAWHFICGAHSIKKKKHT